LDRQVNNSALQKINIACKTCDVSDSFYSSMSIKRFRLEHLGHEVIEGNTYDPTAGLGIEPPNGRHAGGKVKLLKVLVELVALPAYPAPVFTITGVREDFRSAFVQVVSPSQRDQVKETLEKGKYLDSGSSDTVYFWEPKSISFSEDANLAMSFGPSSPFGSNPAGELYQSDAPSASPDADESQIAAPGRERSALAVDEVAPQESPVVVVPPGPFEYAAPQPPSGSLAQPEAFAPHSAKTGADAAASSPAPEPEAPTKTSRESAGVLIPGRPAGTEAAATSSSETSQRSEVEEDDYLLVSRAGYIEKGPEKKSEAVRISRLLRPFRWRIEPAYTIGVIVDDILSIEAANGEIGGDLTKQIEGAGYRLSRVSVEKGKPVAWFKKEPASERDAFGL
jgi:hypothetical protein